MTTKQQHAIPILLVDDEESWLKSLSITLKAAGASRIVTCSDSRQVADQLAAKDIGLVVLDLTMPHISGQELLAQIIERHPDMPVIIVTGVNDIETAVDCIKSGAMDYFVKTEEMDRLVSGVIRTLEFQSLRRENDRMKERFLGDHLERPEVFANIVGESPKMRAVFQYLEAISVSQEPLLITGETGVGKELFARASHDLSGFTGEFVAVNAAGLDEQAFSDTLFGHKKGAFTGADTTRPGLIERAQGGTMFLDEIGDLAPELQVKLLRLLQEHEYFPLGSDVSKRTDARFVVATNCDLSELVRQGKFRKDLFYRLTTHLVNVPPLRERRDDLHLLLDHFLREASAQLGKPVPTIPRELVTLLRLYSFPGNVREFRGLVHEALVHHQSGILSMALFKRHIQARASLPDVSGDDSAPIQVTFPENLPTLREMDALLIDEAMARTEGNQAMAAELLGISRQALNKRLRTRDDGESNETA